MTVTDKNRNEYLEIIRHCKYQVTFPSINTDTLYVVCTFGVNLENTPRQACKECIGKECKNIKVRKYNDDFVRRVYGKGNKAGS